MKNENDNYRVSLLIEIDPEKKAVYLNDYTQEKYINGFSKRFKNKKDIIRLFENYLYKNVDINLEEKKEKNIMDIEKTKEKISEKDKLKNEYNLKLDSIKQHYGVEFTIYYFNDNNINKIRFYNLEYKETLKNINMVYDNKNRNINFIFYDYEKESDIKQLNERNVINSISKNKQLKIVIEEIKRLNNEYRIELEQIENKYKKIDSKELQLDNNKKSDDTL